ncbi:hypothetical protein FGADI_3406 [Fusarium gaditjirri]|uniref:DUF7908 domain-containing protein n=1 Tax=Fusarium gaditjirri TaxID=282569 RepID=A0A8H4TFN6_9HYPO|nr:hypothetical protein FGADI_3406 [Fusarium gaditjirri]
MSLAQHVTQTEGFDYEGPANPNYEGPSHPNVLPDFGTGNTLVPEDEGDQSGDRSEWRRLNFAPVEVVRKLPNIAAYKVSNLKRYVQVATGIIACWFAAGIVFGFAALKPILVKEGIYSELCPVVDYQIPCAEQDMRLNLLFISASISANVSSLLAGAVLDRFGRRVCWLVSSVLLTLGSLMMAISFSHPGFHGYLVGNILLAFGGTFIFVSSYQLANAFPKYSGLIVALVTGAFDASAAVFLFYRMAYEASGGSLSLDKFFYGYISVPVAIFLAEFLWMPAHSYHTLPQLEKKIEHAQDRTRDVHESDEEIDDTNELTRVRSARAVQRKAKLKKIEELAGDSQERGERVKEEEGRQEASGVWGVLHGMPAHKQMMTPWFILILVLTILQMIRMNYFIAGVRSQYRYMLGSDKAAEHINEFFDAALPIGGVAATPFIGILLNNLSVPTTFFVLTVFIIVIGVLNCIPNMMAGYFTVVTFVFFRPLYYSAVSDYATKVFGFATFGRIYGTITCISGITQLIQSGLDALTHGPLHDDPTPVNAALGAVGALVGLILTVFITVKGRVFVEKKVEMEADDERERLLPDAQDGTSKTFDAFLTASTTFKSAINSSLALAETLQSSQSLSGEFNELITTSAATDTSTANSDPTRAPGHEDLLVVFRIVPDIDNSKNSHLKRALGGFVGSASEVCQDASSFSLSNGRLLDGGRPIYYNDEDFTELRGQQVTVPRGGVATTFAGDGGFLRFRSPGLPNGEAGFCQPRNWLSVVGVDECEDGQTSGSAAPTSTDLQTDSVATSVPFNEATTTDALPTDASSSESQLTTEGTTSNNLEATTSTLPMIDTLTSELSVSASGTGTTVDIGTTIDMETTTNIETTSTAATLESASTSDITTDVSTSTTVAEATTTTSPPSRACESYLVNPTTHFRIMVYHWNPGYEITYRVDDDAGYRAVNIDWCVVDEDDVVTHFMVILRAYNLSNPESVFMRCFQSNGGKSAAIDVQNLVDSKSQQFSYNMEDAVPDGCTVLFFTIEAMKELFMCRRKGGM